MDAKHWEQYVNVSLRNIRLDTKLRCQIEENDKGNRWRIKLVDSSHDTSFTGTNWLGGESCMRIIDGMDMVFRHLASRETFFQEVGQQYADILGLKPSDK